MTRRLAVFLAAAAALLSGCAHPAPRAIALPATHVVRSAVVAARTSNARAVAIATRIQKTGVVAGSADAKDLLIDTTETDSELAAALAKVDVLTAQLLAAQQQVDAQTSTLASLTLKYNAAVKTIWWYRIRFWGPLLFAVLSVVVFLVARFTAWGARTLGPYLVDAEHVAVKAAVLA